MEQLSVQMDNQRWLIARPIDQFHGTLESLKMTSLNRLYPCGSTPTPAPTNKPTPRPTNKPTPRPTQPTPKPTQPTGNCADYNQYCATWASTGECCKNPAYMNQYCRKSGRLCESGGGGGSCTNASPHCNYWAQHGYCRSNYAYMSQSCRQACRMCWHSKKSNHLIIRYVTRVVSHDCFASVFNL